MSTLSDRLREQPLPGEAEAAVRAWPVVEAALVERVRADGQHAGRGRPSVRRRALRLALVCALLGVGLVAALTPAGADVGNWIEDRFAGRADRATPAFAGLPEGGSALAISRSGTYAVHPDGGSRWLGSFTQAAWSPRGLHVVGVDRRRVVAVNPAGTPKWAIARPSRVHHPAWSLGEGFAVAYLEGQTLRAVAGNGDPTTDRPLRKRAAAVTPAWRPGSDRVLAFATRGGAVEAVDVGTGRTLWRASVGGIRGLGWSRNARRLVALSSGALTVLGADGRRIVTLELPGTGRELAVHPSGTRAAVVVGRSGATRVVEVPFAGAAAAEPAASRQLFQGDVAGLAWSEDGRRLLLGWRGAGQWLVLGPGERVRALNDVSRELGAAGGFPRVAGWCCPG